MIVWKLFKYIVILLIVSVLGEKYMDVDHVVRFKHSREQYVVTG